MTTIIRAMALLCALTYTCSVSCQTPLPLRYQLNGDQIFGSFGQQLSTVQDLDGDNIADFLVSAIPQGRVFVYSGATGTLLFTLLTTGLFDDFGASICGLADINGDGTADIAVGAPGDDNIANDAGRVDFFSGADGAFMTSIFGDFAEDRLGNAVSGIDDLNGDGISDILVGAPGTFANGYVRTISGSDFSTLSTFFGPHPGSAMGWQVAALDDIDGDGLQEIATTAVRADDNSGNAETGRVLVIAGSGTTILVDVFGLSAGDHLGLTLAALPDIDGDNKGDLIVGSTNDSRGGPDAGSALVISGGTASTLFDILGQQPFALFGSAVAHVGDMNGDGVADFAIGATFHDGPVADSGLVSIRSGATGNLLEEFTDTISSSQWGASIAGLGDINQDGFSEFIGGRPNSSGTQIFAGSLRVMCLGGVRSYGSTNLPPTNRVLFWEPGPEANRSNGDFIIDGADPFDLGVVAVSFAPGELDFSGLPVLLNTAPTLLIINHNFVFQLDGTAIFPTDIASPFLTGIRVYLQGFDAQFPYGATNGIELRLL